MSEPVLKGTPINLTLEQLQEILRAAEEKLEVAGKVMRAELLAFTKGTIGAREANLASFRNTEETLPPVVLLPVPAGTAKKKERFFNTLPARELEIISYADVFVKGAEAEVVACRSTAEMALPEEPPVCPSTQPSASPEPGTLPATLPVPFPIPVPVPVPVPIPIPFPIPFPVEVPLPFPSPFPELVTTPATPSPAPMPAPASAEPPPLISPQALQLIAKAEGFDQPSRWPGGASGITIGVGYDLGYMTEGEFREDWHAHLSAAHINRLCRAIGKTGAAARAIASQFRDITIPKSAAEHVFQIRTIPRYRQQALKAFPGMEKLPPNAQGALISLVFNRGPAMHGERRREMRAIRDLIRNFHEGDDVRPLLNSIADEIQEMKRLWVGQGLNGLLARRDAEATLVRTA